jgi:hypothetical protein
MRRLLRHVLTFCSALSLMLCVAVCVLWVWSYSNPVQLFFVEHPPRPVYPDDMSNYVPYVAQWSFSVVSSHGHLTEKRMHVDYHWPGDTSPEPDWWPKTRAGHRKANWSSHLGFGVSYVFGMRTPYRGPIVTGHRDRWMPHWLLAVVTAVMPLFALTNVIRKRLRTGRTRRGLCPACGYDLRASPQRCPECGAAAAAAVHAV